MCVKPKRAASGKITGFTLDFKATIITMSSLMVIFSFLSTLRVHCDNSTVYAKEQIIRPEAESVFVRMHRPFEKRLDDMCYDSKLSRMMIERLVSDKVKSECIAAVKDSTWKIH